MDNKKITIYTGNRSSDIVKSNDGNNQTDIVPSNQDSEIDYLSRLTSEQLLECKRIHNHALVYCGDYVCENKENKENKETGLSTEDRAKIAAANRAEDPNVYLKEDGVLQAKFPNRSNSTRTNSRSKKKSAKEEQQIATDNLILELKTQKQVVEDFLANERLGEPEREIIKNILDEEANEYSTTEDIKPILKNYLIHLKQKIESLDKTSTDADYRKNIHKAKAYKRARQRTDEAIQAILWSWNGKVPTLERIAEYIVERDNDTKTKELLALNQYQGNIAEFIEVFVIPRSKTVISEHDDPIQMMLVPIDADIEEFVAQQNPNLVPYLHPAYEESNDKYALTAFSPVNNLSVDISKDENNILSTDGFNGYGSVNPNNNLLLEQAKVQSNATEAKLLSIASDVKQLPAAESADGNNDSNNSSAIVLVGDKDTRALDLTPITVSTLDALDTNEEVVSLTLTNPVGVLNAIIVEENLEERNKNGYIVKSNGEEVFHSSCKNLATIVLKKTEKIKPLFFEQLVEGDASYYDRVNNVTRVYIANTGETVTYEGLVKLGKFATDEEIAVDEDKVLEATIKNAANVVEVTQYDGPALQSLKNDYQLTVAIAQDIVRTYWNLDTIKNLCGSNTVLSNEEYETYRYEEWNGQRDLLPFPTKQEYEKFVGFIKNIRGNDGNIAWDSLLLMIDLKRTLNLLNSQDLDAARELKTQIDEEAKAQARRKIEESKDSEEAVIEELSSSTQELLDLDVQINKDIESNSEAELEDLGFVDPTINISSKDLSILEEILQSKLSDKRLPLKHRMVWRKFFESVAYEKVSTETINEKLTKARKLLHRS